MSTRTWLSLLTGFGTTLVLVAAPMMSTGCTQIECAEGTIEQNGECVPSDGSFDDTNCGQGTVLGDDGTCVAEMDPTICGPNTVPDMESMPGVTVCVGVGGVDSCNTPLPCPSASTNKVTVCGRLYDIETDAPIEAAAPTFQSCLSGGAADGPCEHDIKFYDAIDFAGNPSTATPLAVDEFTLDDCGRYVARNINRPSLGFLGIGVDDRAGTGNDIVRNTGVAFPVASQQVRSNQKTYVLATATDDAWSADVSFGDNTFVDRGVYMAIFYHGATPVSGVTVTGANGAARPADDYYFSDTAPLVRSTVTTAGSATGVNGAALLLNSGLVEHSGTGGEPAGCVWPSDLAASIPGVLFFNPRIAEVNATTECP